MFTFLFPEIPKAIVMGGMHFFNNCFLLQPSEEIYTKDENGKILFETVDLCAIWEVSECIKVRPQRNPKENVRPGFYLWLKV